MAIEKKNTVKLFFRFRLGPLPRVLVSTNVFPPMPGGLLSGLTPAADYGLPEVKVGQICASVLQRALLKRPCP